jgi:hypothetical protein
MALLNQIKESQLSKQGKTNPTGVFEGTPQNVAIVERGYSVPNASAVINPALSPIDVTFNLRDTQTYLGFLKSTKR